MFFLVTCIGHFIFTLYVIRRYDTDFVPGSVRQKFADVCLYKIRRGLRDTVYVTRYFTRMFSRNVQQRHLDLHVCIFKRSDKHWSAFVRNKRRAHVEYTSCDTHANPPIDHAIKSGRFRLSDRKKGVWCIIMKSGNDTRAIIRNRKTKSLLRWNRRYFHIRTVSSWIRGIMINKKHWLAGNKRNLNIAALSKAVYKTTVIED